MLISCVKMPIEYSVEAPFIAETFCKLFGTLVLIS